MIDEGKPERKKVWKKGQSLLLLLHYRSLQLGQDRKGDGIGDLKFDEYQVLATMQLRNCSISAPYHRQWSKETRQGKSQILAKQQKWIEAASTYLTFSGLSFDQEVFGISKYWR